MQRHIVTIPCFRWQGFLPAKIEFAVDIIFDQGDVVPGEKRDQVRFFFCAEREAEWILTVGHEPAGFDRILIERLLKRIQQTQVSNPVVISGDIHSFFANDLKLDFDNPASPIVATEFVGTSISSHGPPYDLIAPALPDNPHVHFFESRRRGYACVDLERAHMQVRMRVVSDAADPRRTSRR